jgi:hypothetical protein
MKKSADRPRFRILLEDAEIDCEQQCAGDYPVIALQVRGDISQPPWAVQPLLKPAIPAL